MPATSQIEFFPGTNSVDSQRTRVDASLVTAHSQVLTGLMPGSAYRYRVRSVAAAGGPSVSTEAILVTAPAGSGPEIGAVSVRQVTGTTASVAWGTSTASVAQVEYGPTANYGSFTLLKVFSSPHQDMRLTGLVPGSTYHFRIKAWDAQGFLGASGDSSFTTAVPGLATLLGDDAIQTERFTLQAGQAAAYQYVAEQSGQASLVRLYVDAGSSTPMARVGLYSDVEGTPSEILSQGSAPGLVSGWVNVNIPSIALVRGTRYWLVVLSPIGSGGLNLRQAASGGSSLMSAQTMLAALPQTWTSGALAARSPLSAYVQQVPPAVTLLAPADGTSATGSVPLSAVVDDDAPVARLQFLVDGLPVGAPLTAPPYTTTWDSTGYSSSRPHVITARATDMQGRSSVSAPVSVEVDSGPVIWSIAVRPGFTTTSSVRVSWRTDVLADAQVEFGPSAAYGNLTSIDPRADWSHEMQLTGLRPGAVYHFRVRSRDANGALAISPDQTFATSLP